MGVKLRKTIHIKVTIDGRPAPRTVLLKVARILRIRSHENGARVTVENRMALSKALGKFGLSIDEITIGFASDKGRTISVKCSRIVSTDRTVDGSSDDSAMRLAYGAKKKGKKKRDGKTKPGAQPNEEPKRSRPINPGEYPLPPMGPRGENGETDD